MSKPGFAAKPILPQRMVFVGGAHMDQIFRLRQPPVAGVSNPANLESCAGGSALNSASVAAALGLDCVLVSPVGTDAFGEHLVDICRERSIDPVLVAIKNASTGIYSAILDPEGHVVIGASDLSIYDRIDEDFLTEHLLPVINEKDGLFVTSNLPETSLAELARSGHYIAAVTISPAKAPRLRGILDRIDLLFTNLGEARTLAQKPDSDGRSLCEWFVSKGVASGCISDSSNDLFGWSPEGVHCVANEKMHAIVDVNGAGDALAGAMLAGICRGMAFDDALRQGMNSARFTLGHDGPFQPGLAHFLQGKRGKDQ
jgi:sugar/nucleoside kinase (ribokinase family)